MKIVIISPFQFRLQRGIERLSKALAEQFIKMGYEVIIYSWSKRNEANKDNATNIKYRTLPKFKYFENKWAAIFYRIWLKIDKPEKVILNFLYHGEKHLPKKFSYIYILNSPASQVPDRYHFINQHVSKFPKIQLVGVSELVKSEAISFIQNKPITLIPNGIDTNWFIPKSDLKSVRKKVLITFAAFEERKGIKYAIDAIAKHQNEIAYPIEYRIFGHGPLKEDLVKQLDSFEGNSGITIHEPIADTLEELQRADIFILLSKGEAFALAPLEAMACGLPIIVSNFEPFTEFVNNSFGRMVDRENEMDIINAINEISENYDEMSRNARTASLAFDWSIVGQKYLKLFQSDK